MLEKKFTKRLKGFGIKNLLLSPDTIISFIVFIAVGFLTGWTISSETGDNFIITIVPVSAAFFSIVLAALAIVSSFTDENFILLWVRAGEFENLVTLFQWNLYLPLVITVFALFIEFVYYNSILLILLIAFFIYMVISLIDLIKFISAYALQRAEFIEMKYNESKPE